MSLQQFPQIGMGPETWGPIFWTTMHIVTLGYPETPTKEERDAAISFFNSFQKMLPCPICREHYSGFLKESPVEHAAISRNMLIFWAFTLHNKVNNHLGKQIYSWDNFIAHMRALSLSGHTHIPATSNLQMNLLVGGTAIVGIALASYFIMKSRN